MISLDHWDNVDATVDIFTAASGLMHFFLRFLFGVIGEISNALRKGVQRSRLETRAIQLQLPPPRSQLTSYQQPASFGIIQASLDNR